MTDRGEDILQQRLAKLERVRQRGIDPYPPRYRKTHTALQAVELFESDPDNDKLMVSVAGRIIAKRGMGKVTFLHIKDGSGRIQAFLKKDILGEDKYAFFKDFDTGDFIGIDGRLFKTNTGEITVEAHEITMLTKSLQPLPEKWHGLTDVEKRYRQRYLDLISNDDIQQIFRVRSQVITAMRRLLDERCFIEVSTPILNPTAGGASAKPFVTHHNTLDRQLFMRIATELHLKRLIIGGLDRVYEIGPIFRNEGISTKHNPEFTSMECYEAYADYNDVMTNVENMISDIATGVLGTTESEYSGVGIDFKAPWKHIELRQAIIEYGGIDFEDYPDTEDLRAKMHEMHVEVDKRMGRGNLIDKLLSTYVEPNLIQPTFLVDYPLEMSPLAKKKPDNPRFVERFEAFAGGMEIANAFTELNDPQDQRERFADQLKLRQAGDEEAEMPDEEFLTALEYGMPPTGGLGVGIDRLVMLLTGQQSIREVILFPQLKTK
ncbi:lysine--tRNA ligase [Chloroflexota bacterium]